MILRTRDRGRSWQGLPAPLESVSEFEGNGLWGLRFGDAHHGYAFGQGLWQTSNGGASWQHGPAPARTVLALEAVQDSELVAVAAPCLPGQSRCADGLTLYHRPISSGNWTAVAGVRTYSFQASIAVHGVVVWVLAGTSLYVSTNGGASFASHSQPCKPRSSYATPTAVTDDGPRTYVVCSGEGAVGSVAKYVYRATGTESSWTPTGRAPFPGNPGDISAGSDSAIVLSAASGASWLYRGTDGGQRWKTVLTEDDGGVGWGDLGFTTSTDGVIIHGPAIPYGTNNDRPGELLLTDDGGQTWQRVHF